VRAEKPGGTGDDRCGLFLFFHFQV
jgi:hypothetical protein